MGKAKGRGKGGRRAEKSSVEEEAAKLAALPVFALKASIPRDIKHKVMADTPPP